MRIVILLVTVMMLLMGCAEAEMPAAATLAPILEPTAAPTLEPTAVPIVDPTDWPAPTAGAITVDATIRSGPISPYLFGSNTGPWSGVPFDLKDEAIDARITMLRWPGGEFADRNAFTTVSLDRFIQLCRELGAEPYVHVRLREGTPEAAAEIVRYANIEMGYGIKYWAVGNEPNLYPPDDVYTSEKVSADWRTLALAMRAVDPSIILMGPEITGYLAPPAGGPFVEEAREMTEAFLRANGDLVDIVTIHRYPFPVTATSGPPTIDELADNVVEWDTMIADLRRLIIETTGRDLPIGVTEFNSNYSKQHSADTTPDSIASAAWLADVLGRMIVGRVTIGTQFALQSTPTLGAWGLLERSRVRPAYYVYPIYKRFGSELVFAAAGDADGAGEAIAHPRLTAYAALTEAGGLTLMVINRGTEPLSMPLSLRGHGGGMATVFRLDAARAEAGTAAAPIEPIALSDGMTIEAPPLSVTLYVVE